LLLAKTTIVTQFVTLQISEHRTPVYVSALKPKGIAQLT